MRTLGRARAPLFGFVIIAIAAAAACNGNIGDTGTTATTADIGASGMRRLTQVEYDDTIADLLGDTTRPGETSLPPDTDTPFDNDYTTQDPSTALIEGVETAAETAAESAMSDPARRDVILGCTPSGPDDAVCMRSFIAHFGRRALRRPLASDEIDRFLALQSYSIEAGDFYAGATFIIEAILQEPEFLYQTEIGTPIDGRPLLRRLTDFEIATRLSYFLTGVGPSDALLDLAAAGKLARPQDRRAAAAELLNDPKARARVERFHALWLGYQSLPESPELAVPMQRESDALVSRVVFDERRDYRDLLRFDQTYVDDTLASHYGLPLTGASDPTWTSWGDTGRRGILSQASVLSANQKFADTSPVQRGYYVRVRLMCDTIGAPPPNVNADNPPSTVATCKKDRYVAHEYGGCADCHKRMDPIGFGLENYDKTGKFRATDDGAPQCPISGDGEVEGVGPFNGPAGLGDLLIQSGTFEPCVVQQIYRFALGRKSTTEDATALAELLQNFEKTDRRFDDLLVEIVASEPFALRRNEQE